MKVKVKVYINILVLSDSTMQREFNQNLSRWRKAVIRYKMEASEASAQLRKIIRKARGDRIMIERLTEKYGMKNFENLFLKFSIYL